MSTVLCVCNILADFSQGYLGHEEDWSKISHNTLFKVS